MVMKMRPYIMVPMMARANDGLYIQIDSPSAILTRTWGCKWAQVKGQS